MRNQQHPRSDSPSILSGFDSSTLQPDPDSAAARMPSAARGRRPAWMVPALVMAVLLLTLLAGSLAWPWL